MMDHEFERWIGPLVVVRSTLGVGRGLENNEANIRGGTMLGEFPAR